MKERDCLNDLLYDFGYLKKDYCGEEENRVHRKEHKEGKPMEEGLFRDYDDRYYRWQRTDITDAELELYLKMKRVRSLSHISASLIFIAVLLFVLFFRGLNVL